MPPFFELPVGVRHMIYKYTVKLDHPVRAHDLHAYIRNRHWLRSSILNTHRLVRVDAFRTFILENTFDILDIQEHVTIGTFFGFEKGRKRYHPQLLLRVEKYISENGLSGVSLMQLRKAVLRAERRGPLFTFVGLELMAFIPGVQELVLDFTQDPKYEVDLYTGCDDLETVDIRKDMFPRSLFSPCLRKLVVLVDGVGSPQNGYDEVVKGWAHSLRFRLKAEGLQCSVKTEVSTRWLWRFLNID